MAYFLKESHQIETILKFLGEIVATQLHVGNNLMAKSLNFRHLCHNLTWDSCHLATLHIWKKTTMFPTTHKLQEHFILSYKLRSSFKSPSQVSK
jgi:hypothetical protein